MSALWRFPTEGKHWFLALAFVLVMPCFAPAAAELKPYPADVKAAFMRSCATVHEEMLATCRCMINQFERRMPLEEFITFSQIQDPTRDRRFTTVANGCVDRHRRSNR